MFVNLFPDFEKPSQFVDVLWCLSPSATNFYGWVIIANKFIAHSAGVKDL